MASRGSFVACGSRGIGKVQAVAESTLDVEFFDSVAQRFVETIHKAEVAEVSLAKETRCYWVKGGHWRVGRVKEKGEDFYTVRYHQTLEEVPTDDLFVRWAKPLTDPTEVLIARGCESPRFHVSRSSFIASLVNQRAASRGLTGALSSRVELHQHQVEIARRILEDPVQRYLLADEVGLGKTIEAGFVLRQFFLDNPAGRALVVVPPLLVAQWTEELATKFAVPVVILSKDNQGVREGQAPTTPGSPRKAQAPRKSQPEQPSRVDGTAAGTRFAANDFPGGKLVIASYEDDDHWKMREGFEIVVLDEAHNIAAGSNSSEERERRRYDRMVDIAKETPRVLLLSATPLVHNEATFLAMLHLLDPAGYRRNDLAHFRDTIAARAAVGRLMLGLTEATPTFLLSDPIEELRRLFPHDARLNQLLDELEKASADEHDDESEEEQGEEPNDSVLARRIRAIRVHVSETHRVYRRLLRTRRSPALEDDFPVRGRKAPEEFTINEPNLLFADAWLDRWRDTVQLALPADVRPEGNQAQGDLASIFLVFLGRAISSLSALSRAVAFRLSRKDKADLTSAEVAGLTGLPLLAEEKTLLTELLQQANDSTEDARALAIAAAVRRFPEKEKTVVFTSYRSTAESLLVRLRELLGASTVAAHLGARDSEDIERELDAFRNDAKRRVLVCDRSAEEGRNFQFAQHLVHYDLPWSPNRLEQRLGRLDRFGRGGTVHSIVFVHGQTTIHDDWYGCLSKAFSIFEHSIAAYQFVVERLMPEIEADLLAEGGGAVAKRSAWVIQQLKDEQQAIEEQDVLDSIEAVERNDTFFEELASMDIDKARLRTSFEGWVSHGSQTGGADLGFANRQNSSNNELFELGATSDTLVPGDWILRLFRAQHKHPGTFSRIAATRTPDVRLFRTGLPICDAIADYSRWDDRGRAFACWRYRAVFTGRDPTAAFRFDYVIEADAEQARAELNLDRGVTPALQRQLDGLFPPLLKTVWVDTSGVEIHDKAWLSLLTEPYNQDLGDANLRSDAFGPVDALFGVNRWEPLCRQARSGSERALRLGAQFRAYVQDHLDRARSALDARLEIVRARANRPFAQATASAEVARESKLGAALLDCVAAPRVRVEAVGFVVLAGTKARG